MPSVLLSFQDTIISHQILNIKNKKKIDDEVAEDIPNTYVSPKQIKLQSNENLKRLKILYVLQYYVPNKENSSE